MLSCVVKKTPSAVADTTRRHLSEVARCNETTHRCLWRRYDNAGTGTRSRLPRRAGRKQRAWPDLATFHTLHLLAAIFFFFWLSRFLHRPPDIGVAPREFPALGYSIDWWVQPPQYGLGHPKVFPKGSLTGSLFRPSDNSKWLSMAKRRKNQVVVFSSA